ncbi:MAG TPA: ribokinase [Candidatus Saccharimonadales bacterium]|nr:ribokinase [Candidatus Saccharimonadales bacterium]
MKRRWDVAVVGGLNTDFLVRGRRLPCPGETVDGEQFMEAAGGKGGNQAVAAARLGAKVGFIGCVGRDAKGASLVQSLRAERINVRHIKKSKRAETGAAIIMVGEGGEKQIQVAPGANAFLLPGDLRDAEEMLTNSRVVVLQLEVPMRTVVRAAQLARKGGAMVILDPAPPTRLPRELLRAVDVIRPNRSEAESLTNVRVKDISSARKAAYKLLHAGLRLVATEAGAEGDLLVWKGGDLLLPRLRLRSVDATGAGDAFVAALAVALAYEASYVQAGIIANAAAALATTKFGAQCSMPRLDEVIQCLSKTGRRKEATWLKEKDRYYAAS